MTVSDNIYNNEEINSADTEYEHSLQHSRKSKMKRRTEPWEDAKAEVARELGLWDKVQQSGWASLTASESGRLGGVLSGRFPGKAPQYAPGSRPRRTRSTRTKHTGK